MKVLITGADGQVGVALQIAAPSDWQIIACDRSQLDVSNKIGVAEILQMHAPDVVVNLAAYTAVDKAETEMEAAELANVVGPQILASEVCKRAACRLIHVSTDFVFDGAASRPYLTGDPTGPLSVYGRTKRDGELAVLTCAGERAVVLRTSWVYSAWRRNFLLTMVRLMRERGIVRVVADQQGSPTSARSVATGLVAAIRARSINGLMHWTDSGATTWHGFALAIAHEGLAAGLFRSLPEVVAISTADFPTPARRPAYSVLDTAEAEIALGIPTRPWRESLRHEIKQIPRG